MSPPHLLILFRFTYDANAFPPHASVLPLLITNELPGLGFPYTECEETSTIAKKRPSVAVTAWDLNSPSKIDVTV